MPPETSRRPKPTAWRFRDLLLAVGSLYLTFAVANLVHQEVRLQRYAVDLAHQRSTVDRERHHLERQLDLYGQAEGVERLARRQLGMARADELPIRFVNGNTIVGAPPAGASPSIESKSSL